MGIHVMVDLETWGTGRNASIVSIGAVKFDETQILDRFHVGIDPESCQRYGLKIDASTMLWWLDAERADARREWLALEKMPLPVALDGFALWMEESETIDGLWGNGATFDNVLLRDAYDAAQLDYPVPFWRDKCYRTLKGLAPAIPLKRVGVHHSAVDDAESQARHAIRIAQHLELVL